MAEMSTEETEKFQKITQQYMALENEIVEFTKKRCGEQELSTSGAPGALLYAFQTLLMEETQESVNSEGGADMALQYIGHNMRIVQSVVKIVDEMNCDIEKFRDKQNKPK